MKHLAKFATAVLAIALAAFAPHAAALNTITGFALTGYQDGQPVVYWYSSSRFVGQTVGVPAGVEPGKLVCRVGYVPPFDPLTAPVDCLPSLTGFAITGYQLINGRLQKTVEWYSGQIALPSTAGIEPQYDANGRLLKGFIVPGVGVVR